MLTYPKSHFSEDHISAPSGCCAPKFLNALENDQVLLAHPPPDDFKVRRRFYNAGPKFWGAHPKKISGTKNMQNLARFRTTSKFGGEYLQSG